MTVPETSQNQPAPTSTPAAPAQEVATSQAQPQSNDALVARLAVLEREAKEARAEAAKYRTRNDEETARRLQEQGDFKTLYEQSKAAIENGKRYEAWAEKTNARIQSETEALPAYLRKAIAAAPTVEDKLEILEEWKAENAKAAPQQPAPKQTAPAHPQGAPGNTQNSLPTLDQLIADGWSLARIKAERPDALTSAAMPKRGGSFI